MAVAVSAKPINNIFSFVYAFFRSIASSLNTPNACDGSTGICLPWSLFITR